MITRSFRLTAAVVAALMTLGLASCSEDDPSTPSTPSTDIPGPPAKAPELDFIVLNQGNFGQSNSSLAFYGHTGNDAAISELSSINLGSVGNDMIEKDDRLYVAVNGSNCVVVYDEQADDTYTPAGKITVAEPRYLAIDGNYLYVTSYLSSTGGIEGSVVKVDIRTLDIAGQLDLDCKPEGIAIVGDKAYIANSAYFDNASGTSTYSDVISVVDLKTFTLADEIHIDGGVNFHHVAADSRGRVWISSRGNYFDLASCIFRLTPGATVTIDRVDILTDNFTIHGGKVYTYAIDYASMTNLYTAVDVNTLATASYLAPAVSSTIATPYGIAIDDEDDIDYIYILDANAYGPTGYVHRIKGDGSAVVADYETGPIPCCIVFE